MSRTPVETRGSQIRRTAGCVDYVFRLWAPPGPRRWRAARLMLNVKSVCSSHSWRILSSIFQRYVSKAVQEGNTLLQGCSLYKHKSLEWKLCASAPRCAETWHTHRKPSLTSWNSKYIETIYKQVRSTFKGKGLYWVKIRTSEIIFLENKVYLSLLRVFVKIVFCSTWR